MAKHVRKPGDPVSDFTQNTPGASPSPSAGQAGAQPGTQAGAAQAVRTVQASQSAQRTQQVSQGSQRTQQAVPRGQFNQYTSVPPYDYGGASQQQASYVNSPNASYASVPQGNRYDPYDASPAAYGNYGQPSATGHTGAFAQVGNYGQTAPDDYVPAQPRSMNVPVKKKKKHLLAKVLVTLLILALAVGAFYLFNLNSRLGFEGGTPREVLAQLADHVSGEPFYMLVLGSDTTDTQAGHYGYSDIMMLVRVDEAGKKMTLLSIPRDSPYHREDGSVVKINEAYHLGGPAESIRAVSQLTGAKISHYMQVNYNEFIDLVDALGGITVNVPTKMTVEDPNTKEDITIEPGVQTLDGRKATVFVRGRKMFEGDQDAARQENVRTATKAIIKKAVDRPFYEVPGAVMELADCVDTDINVLTAIALSMGLVKAPSELVIYSGSGPSDGDYDPDSGLWLCYENPEGWAAIMAAVDKGDDPSKVSVKPASAAAPAAEEPAAEAPADAAPAEETPADAAPAEEMPVEEAA